MAGANGNWGGEKIGENIDITSLLTEGRRTSARLAESNKARILEKLQSLFDLSKEKRDAMLWHLEKKLDMCETSINERINNHHIIMSLRRNINHYGSIAARVERERGEMSTFIAAIGEKHKNESLLIIALEAQLTTFKNKCTGRHKEAPAHIRGLAPNKEESPEMMDELMGMLEGLMKGGRRRRTAYRKRRSTRRHRKTQRRH